MIRRPITKQMFLRPLGRGPGDRTRHPPFLRNGTRRLAYACYDWGNAFGADFFWPTWAPRPRKHPIWMEPNSCVAGLFPERLRVQNKKRLVGLNSALFLKVSFEWGYTALSSMESSAHKVLCA